MQGIEDCVFALRAAATIGGAQARAEHTQAVMSMGTATGSAVALDEAASKAALARYGVRVPRATICSAAETPTAADAIGYPVVLKAVASELAHKSELGAVVTSLADSTAVRQATERMARDFSQFMVEEMVQPCVAELIVGISRDASFGLALLLGTGGTMVELVRDTKSLLLPASREQIAAALDDLIAGALLKGYRGGHAGNMDATLEAIEAIIAFAIDQGDSLLELDVNPLLVTPNTAVAVDAFIRRLE